MSTVGPRVVAGPELRWQWFKGGSNTALMLLRPFALLTLVMLLDRLLGAILLNAPGRAIQAALPFWTRVNSCHSSSGATYTLSYLLLVAFLRGSDPPRAAPTTPPPCFPLQEHDLFGSRDFLDAESAEKVLAPLLATGALIKKVGLLGKLRLEGTARLVTWDLSSCGCWRPAANACVSFVGSLLIICANGPISSTHLVLPLWYSLPPDQIRFSTKSFGREAAHVAARALHQVAHCLEHADMSDVIAGRPVSGGAGASKEQGGGEHGHGLWAGRPDRSCCGEEHA